MYYTFIILCIMLAQQPSFKDTQLTNTRVRAAYAEKEAAIKKMFSDKGLSYSGFKLFLRAFKKEEKLEVWIKEKGKATYSILHTYQICSSSGELGPKRMEGDFQVPEGIYHINHFNPQSQFHLSLGINYPNASDRILSDRQKPGSAIYIHGNCVTIGCIPITNDKIKELYVLAVEARNNGQEKIPIHIFPTILNESEFQQLKANNSHHSSFWENLKSIYEDFNTTKKVKPITVSTTGEYSIKD
jgi:murein L,D-transpeptidase YafK